MKSTFSFLIASSVGALFFAQTTVNFQKTDSLRKVLGSKISQIKPAKASLSNGQVPPNEYNIQDYKRTMNIETGRPHTQNLVKVREELKEGRYKTVEPLSLFSSGSSETGRSVNANWIERGPYDVGGRTRAIMFDPNDATGKRVFAGAVSGGLWVNNDITNPNSEWTPIDDMMANTSISCIVSDPNNPQIFYAGTGESSTRDIIGSGVWKSTDGGSTWTQLLIPTGNYSSNGQIRGGVYYVNDIKVRNNNGTSEVYVGVSGAYASGTFNGIFDSGLYKSTDGGDNFSRIESLYIQNYPNTTQKCYYAVQEIEIAADNSVWISTKSSGLTGISSGGRIFQSADGVNFTEKYNGNNAGSRVQIAVSKTDPNKVYGLLHISNNATEKVRIVKSINGGSSWSATGSLNLSINLPNDVDTDIPANDFTRGQAYYDLVIGVAPDNDNEVYIGGIDLFKSVNGGLSWTQISKWSNNNNLATLNASLVHADQHAIVFNPHDSSKMIFGNDGGIFYTNNKSTINTNTGIEARNKRYNVTQFYDAKMNPQSTDTAELMVAGAQDNGTQLFQGAPTQGTLYDTSEFTGGDGGMVEFDDQSQYIISSYVYNNFYLYNIPNNTWSNLVNDNRSSGSFINEMALDRNQDVFYSNGSNMNVVRVTGLATGSLSESTFNIVAPSQGEGISTMKVSPHNTTSTNLYVGTTIGKLYKVTTANTAHSTTTINTPIAGTISSISFGGRENDIILTVSNYGENTNKVYYTTNGGVTWDAKQGDLPDMPVRASFMNPDNNDEVILGTEMGIWQTNNFLSSNPTWTKSPGNIGTVRVTALDYRPSTKTLLAATYGRGVYTAKNVNLATDEVGATIEVFNVYPNPSRGSFKLNLPSKYAKSVDVKVYDASGKLVFQKEDVKSGEELRTNLTTGAYILEASNNGEQVFTSKVMIK